MEQLNVQSGVLALRILGNRPATMGWTRFSRGPVRGVPWVALHGFTGSGLDYEVVADCLPMGQSIVALDLFGHGQSPGMALAEVSLDACADSVVAAMVALKLSRPVMIGYSMGGRVLLHTIVQRPDLARGMILVGASPGIADDKDRHARQQADAALADRIRNEGVEWFSRWWEEHPLIRSQRRISEPFRSRLTARRRNNNPQQLAMSLLGMGTGSMQPLWDALGQVRVPTCLVVGEEDTKYRTIAAAMHTRLLNSECVTLPAAGHAAHLEAPVAFMEALVAFAAAIERPESDLE